MKAVWYALVVLLGALGLLSGFRAIELLLTGGLTAYGAGRLAGSLLVAVILLLLAWKALAKARTG